MQPLPAAVCFLNGKWNTKASDVRYARDFTNMDESIPGTSEKPYFIRLNAGKEIESGEFRLAELGNPEIAARDQRVGAVNLPAIPPRIVTTARSEYTSDGDNL
jgi:hypothetical protein